MFDDGLGGHLSDDSLQDFYEDQFEAWNDYEDTDDRLNSLINENEDWWEDKEDVEDFK